MVLGFLVLCLYIICLIMSLGICSMSCVSLVQPSSAHVSLCRPVSMFQFLVLRLLTSLCFLFRFYMYSVFCLIHPGPLLFVLVLVRFFVRVLIFFCILIIVCLISCLCQVTFLSLSALSIQSVFQCQALFPVLFCSCLRSLSVSSFASISILLH